MRVTPIPSPVTAHVPFNEADQAIYAASANTTEAEEQLRRPHLHLTVHRLVMTCSCITFTNAMTMTTGLEASMVPFVHNLQGLHQELEADEQGAR